MEAENRTAAGTGLYVQLSVVKPLHRNPFQNKSQLHQQLKTAHYLFPHSKAFPPLPSLHSRLLLSRGLTWKLSHGLEEAKDSPSPSTHRGSRVGQRHLPGCVVENVLHIHCGSSLSCFLGERACQEHGRWKFHGQIFFLIARTNISMVKGFKNNIISHVSRTPIF